MKPKVYYHIHKPPVHVLSQIIPLPEDPS